MPLPIYETSDFVQGLLGLMPTGRAWPRDPETVFVQCVSAQAPSYTRLHARANYLLVDAFPSTTLELLPEWEYSLGLPDPCAGEEPSVALRQAQVVARLTQTDGPSVPSLTAFAAVLGYPITITEFAPLRFSFGFGSYFGGTAKAFVFQVNAPSFTIQYFKFGSGHFGDYFSTFGNTVLQCELSRLKPAHTLIQYSYS